jgi:glucose 1-dehydrogenase
LKLAGKTALVTGSGRGIGRACAIELARHGADVVINDRPGSPDLQDVSKQIVGLGRRCFAIEADVFSRSGCQRLFDSALDRCRQVDILVSNPALNTRSSFLDQDPDEFERMIQANLISGFHISQLVARHMVDRGEGGKIVFVSSVQAELPMAGNIAYGPAKAALNHLARSIAVELSPHQIHVNAIEPGWIDTPGERASFGDELIRREAQRLPLGRLGRPDEIGKAVVFLCSSDADYVSGTILVVDGLFRYKDLTPNSVLAPDEASCKTHPSERENRR